MSRERGQVALFRVEGQEGQIEHQGQPVAVNEEEESEETVNGGFWDDVGVETVAEIDGVDIVAF